MIDPKTLLHSIPAGLRDPLIEEYKGIMKAYSEGRWKLAGLDAGRFCEVVYTILEGALSGNFSQAPSKPNRFPDACKALESKQPIPIGDHSLRILIPRVLPGLYDVRNNRDIGHVGGDVTSNKMDAAYLKSTCTWIMSELIRVFHQASTAEAQKVVDALADHDHPLIWEIEGIRRVLDASMSAPERALVLLYSVAGWCDINTLEAWVKGGKNFRSNVLDRLAPKLLIEVQYSQKRVVITPLGIKKAEEILAKSSKTII